MWHPKGYPKIGCGKYSSAVERECEDRAIISEVIVIVITFGNMAAIFTRWRGKSLGRINVWHWVPRILSI